MNLEQTSLPFARGGTEHSRHASYTGAVAAKKLRGVKTQLYLQWLRRYGPATDQDAIAALGRDFPVNVVTSIRNTLKTHGFIEDAGDERTAIGTRRTLWRAKEV